MNTVAILPGGGGTCLKCLNGTTLLCGVVNGFIGNSYASNLPTYNTLVVFHVKCEV